MKKSDLVKGMLVDYYYMTYDDYYQDNRSSDHEWCVGEVIQIYLYSCLVYNHVTDDEVFVNFKFLRPLVVHTQIDELIKL